MRLVSIVIPTLNEDVAAPLAEVGAYLGGLRGWRFEIWVVDDSADHVRTRVSSAIRAAKLPENVIAELVEGPREGKGAAVRSGICRTRGDYVFLMDADLPAPVQCIEGFLRLLERGADVVIAERVLHREFSSAARWLVSRGLLVMQRAFVFHSNEFSDTQCGFKAFRGDFLREIAREQIVKGGMYDLEYLYIAAHKHKIIEKIAIVPTAERRISRINIWKCLRRDPVDVLRVKAHGLLGGYR